jgi:ATP-dependent Clp protease ATP-binding subunit ClpC
MKNLNLTPRAQKLIKEAHKICFDLKNTQITHIHLFISFLNLKQSQIDDAFGNFGFDTFKIKNTALSFAKMFKASQKQIPLKEILLSEGVKNIFKCSKSISAKFDHKYIGLEHIFLSLFEIPDENFEQFLISNKYEFSKVVSFVEHQLEEDDMLTGIEESSIAPENNQNRQFDIKKYKILNTYATNLNVQVINGKINNLHLNKELIQKISEVLCRKNKNNPLIIGEAGVGKTALVESLAQAIVKNEVSDLLCMKQIYNLDIPMMIAGCKYRGEFEEKIKNLLKEIVDDQYIILFIDEIHTIIGAGNPENGNDVANILKPYLARGEISCIGATTFDEYKKTISDDPALSRRFQTIKIEEPNKQQTFDLLINIKSGYENFHMMNLSDDILHFILNSAERYIEGRFPDKALDIIDQVGAKVKLKNVVKSPEMIKIEKKLNKIVEDKSFNSNPTKVASLEDLLKKYEQSTKKMILDLKDNKYIVTENDILEVIADKTNIPIDDLKLQDFDKIKMLKNKLSEEIVGQENQITQIYKSLIRAKAGFRNHNKPICSLLFAGPTGVGKTMTAKVIAENLFINKNNFIVIDMSEYTDKSAVSKLLGSNPGYIGFDKGGVLTEKVRKNPYSLILFDEIQKADPDVLYTLLQILEEGKVTDSSGKTVDFSNSIIVMTTNIGSDALNYSSMGFGSKRENKNSDVFSSLKNYFPSDLLNRIDEIIVYNILSDSQIKTIITKQLQSFKQDLYGRGINLKFSSEIIDFLFKKIQFDNFGARQVIKTIQRELQTKIAEKIIESEKNTNLEICVKEDNICVI